MAHEQGQSEPTILSSEAIDLMKQIKKLENQVARKERKSYKNVFRGHDPLGDTASFTGADLTADKARLQRYHDKLNQMAGNGFIGRH